MLCAEDWMQRGVSYGPCTQRTHRPVALKAKIGNKGLQLSETITRGNMMYPVLHANLFSLQVTCVGQ